MLYFSGGASCPATAPRAHAMNAILKIVPGYLEKLSSRAECLRRSCCKPMHGGCPALRDGTPGPVFKRARNRHKSADDRYPGQVLDYEKRLHVIAASAIARARTGWESGRQLSSAGGSMRPARRAGFNVADTKMPGSAVSRRRVEQRLGHF